MFYKNHYFIDNLANCIHLANKTLRNILITKPCLMCRKFVDLAEHTCSTCLA